MRAEATSVEFRLRSAQGHLEGVIRMVEEGGLKVIAPTNWTVASGGCATTPRIRACKVSSPPNGTPR
jgi:hypothetical protein